MQPIKENTPITLNRKQWLEMEIGITGGEEDGVNNEDVDNNSLYTQPEDIYNIYKTLSPISPYFSIAAGFGVREPCPAPLLTCANQIRTFTVCTSPET
jgi:fructose/tagatose bisphosphate aldolase